MLAGSMAGARLQMRKRRYRIAALLGRGGFGSVYKAEKLGEEGFSTIVAIKLLHAMGGGSNPALEKARSDAVRRLRDEARLLGLLKHRAIVQVYDLERLRGEWAIVMEYVDGIQLAELLELVRVPPRQALAIVEEVADALHTAYHFEPHGQALHLLHRDIKPSNVMLTRGGSVKVLDFGIARANFEARESQTAGFLIGTQNYMSPEHLDFDDDTIQVAAASDIYGLGAVLFELLAHQPFGRASLDPLQHQEKVHKQLDAHILGRVPHGLYELLERMLSFAPGVRPTALELRTACEDLQSQMPGESLRAWCERVVAPVLRGRTVPRAGNDPILGSVLEEGELPEGAFLDSYDRTVAAKASPSTYDVGDTWGEGPQPVSQASPEPTPAAPAAPRPAPRHAGEIALDQERDGPAPGPVAIDSPIDRGEEPEVGGFDIALEGEGDWEPRPGRRAESSDGGAGARRMVLLGAGLGALAMLAVGIWGLSRVLDGLERGEEPLQEPPALVAGAELEAEAEGEAEPAAVPPAPAREPEAPAAPARAERPPSSPVPAPVAHPAPAAAPASRQASAPSASQKAPEEPPAPVEPEDRSAARLAAIAALRGGSAPQAPVEEPAAAEPPIEPAPTEPPPAEPAPAEPSPPVAVASVEEAVVPAPAEPPPPPAPGGYRVQGNAIEVFLKSGGRRFDAGTELEAGRYDIWALFDRSPGAAPIRVGVARIEPGVTVTIDCDASMTLCRAL
jgi:predicted Ser/Thr protein kinase